MVTAEDRIWTLEMRAERLETWTGPGQTESLGVNIRAFRADLVAFRRVQNQHGVLLGKLTGDVSGLKADVAELQAAIDEILRRLPEPPSDSTD
jgi:hypothetical protein